MIFDDVGGKDPIINEYFCRGRHINCNMIHPKQKNSRRKNVRENCNLFIFFEQRGRATTAIDHVFFCRVELSYGDFSSICEKVCAQPYNSIVINKTKNRNIDGKLRSNWDRRAL